MKSIKLPVMVFIFITILTITVFAEVPIIKLGVPNVSRINCNSSDFWDNDDTFLGAFNREILLNRSKAVTFGDSVITKGMIIYNDVQNDPKGMLNITIASKPGSPGVARFGGIVMRNLNASSVGSPPFAIIPGWDGNYNTELLFFVNNTYEVKFGKFGITSVDGFLAADLGSFKSATRGALSYYMPWDGSIESEMMFSGATARPSRFAFKSYYYDTAWHGIGDIMRIEAYNTGQNVSLINASLSVDIDIKAGGNITSENVFIPQDIFSHTNRTIQVIGANEWTNVTFDQEVAEIMQGILHNAGDDTNQTFTITQDGVYFGDYDFDIEDNSGVSTDVEIAGRLIYINGTEVVGSDFESGIEKKGVEKELSHDFLFYAKAGDSFIFQFVGSDADIQISTHGTFGDHPESASIILKKERNL